MNFSLDIWKGKAGAQLRQCSDWLARRTTQDTPYLVYGTLCGLSLWPLIEAAQSGALLPVAVAFGSVAAGVGGNLIAEQIQRWKDGADDVDQDEVTRWVVAHAEDAALREALDAVLEAVQAIPQAQAGLDTADRRWFDETLRKELAQLGNLGRFEATLIGDGAIAQDHSVAAGAGGVAVRGDVGGDAVAGGKTVGVDQRWQQVQNQTNIERQFIGDVGTDPQALRGAYLSRLMGRIRGLSLSGVDRKAAQDEDGELQLSAVYTALWTQRPEMRDTMDKGLGEGILPTREGKETHRLSALDVLNREERLVLLGDPGGGKSTFVNFVALCLAGESLGDAEVNLASLTAPLPDEKEDQEPQPWDHGPLLPVRVVLRDLAARGLPDPEAQPADALDGDVLWNFIVAELGPLREYAPHLKQELLEDGGLILLDGLDEVPDARQRRAQVKRVVGDFATCFSRCRFLVTSRTYAYQRQDWKLSGFAEVVLSPFTPAQIKAFVARWYAHVGAMRGMHADDAQGRAALLQTAITRSARLTELAARPLLLTLMASLHAWRGGSLPEKREALYADTVDLLLDQWESPKVVRDAAGRPLLRQPSLAEWLKVDREVVRVELERLAFEAQRDQPQLVGTADVSEARLVTALMQVACNPEVNPARLVEYICDRAGLLTARGTGVYTFPHRTFQEYLAACHLTDYDFPDRLAALTREDPQRWREVALLAGAKAARGTSAGAWLLAEALCYQDPPAEDAPLEEGDGWGALLAAQSLVENESERLNQVVPRNVPKLARVRRWQVAIVRRGWLPPVDRAAAGRALSHLGDPRPGVGVDPETGLPDFVWCEVPAGPFLMGSGDDDEMAYDDEKPRHSLTLSAFKISQYPVTNSQYRPFVAGGGYGERRYWTAEGWAEKEKRGWTVPGESGAPFNLDNHPVVKVSWYEAVAYCRWLTEVWQAAGRIGPDEVVRLPSEAEWEKAARGTDGRRHPWGDEVDPARANYNDTGIGSTSAVGCFPNGASPYGCLDMAGNVWEWTSSLNKGYPYDAADGREDLEADGLRVLRGGAFGNNRNLVRCALRVRFSPDGRDNYVGVRVVVSSIPPALHSGVSALRVSGKSALRGRPEGETPSGRA